MESILSSIAHWVVLAASPAAGGGAGNIISSGAAAACSSNCGSSSLTSLFGQITNALIFLIGAISVIMIVIGGLRFVLSNGDPKSAESARNTVLYAVIGVIVAIASWSIVTFVTTNFK